MGQSFNVEGVLSLQDKGFSNTLKNAANSLNGFGKNAGSSFDGANRSMDGLSQKADQARSSILNIAAGIGAMQLVGKAVDMVKNSVSGAISRFDTLNQYPKVMEQLGYSAKDVNKSMDTLQNGIKGLPTALDDVVSTTQQFASITGDVDTAAKTTIALNDAFLASGSSSADAARGLQQYTQMLSSGKVDLMSWRTLQETMPASLKKVAEAFGYAGKSATNDLYAALQDGTITMDQLNQKFVELDGGVNGFAKTARTASGGIKTSFENIQTSITRGMANMLSAIDKGMTDNGFPTMAENINKGQTLIDSAFKKLNGSIPGVITNMKNFGGSLGPLSGLLTAVSTGVMGLMAFSTVAPQINATFLALKNVGSAFSVILSPIGLIAAGIALLAVAFYKAYTTSEPFRNAIDNIAKTIHGGFDSAIQGVAKALESMGVQVGSTTGIFQQLSQALDTPKGQMVAFGAGALLLVGGLTKMVSPVGLVTGMFGKLGGIFKGLIPSFGSTASSATSMATSIEGAGTKASTSGSLFGGFSGAVLKVGLAIGIAAAGLGIFAFGIAAIAAQGESGTEAISGLTVGIAMIIGVLAACSPLFTANVEGLTAFGNTALKVGASVAIAAVGIAILVAAITKLAVTGKAGVTAIVAVTVAIIALAATFAILGPALTSSVVGIVGFGAAVALIGAGIGIASAGVAALVTAFTGLVAVSAQIIPAMTAVGQGFTAMMVGILAGVVANVALITQAFTAMGVAILQSIIILAPMIGQAFVAIGQAILTSLTTLIPQIITLIQNTIIQILNALTAIIPSFITFIDTLITALVNELVALSPMLINAGLTIIQNLLNGINSHIEDITTTAIEIIVKFVNTIASHMGEIVDSAVNLIVSFVNGVADNLGKIIDAAVNLIGKFVMGIIKAMPQIVDQGLKAVEAFVQGVGEVIGKMHGEGLKLIMLFVKGIIEGIKDSLGAGKKNANAVKDGVSGIDLGAQGRAIINSFKRGLERAFEGVKSFVSGIAGWIKSHKGPISYDKRLLIPAGKAIMNGLNNGLDTAFGAVQSNVSSMSDRISEAMSPDISVKGISGMINSANKKIQNGLETNMSGEMNLTAQPAYINLSMGGSTFSTFTDNITHQQELQIQQRFGRGF